MVALTAPFRTSTASDSTPYSTLRASENPATNTISADGTPASIQTTGEPVIDSQSGSVIRTRKPPERSDALIGHSRSSSSRRLPPMAGAQRGRYSTASCEYTRSPNARGSVPNSSPNRVVNTAVSALAAGTLATEVAPTSSTTRETLTRRRAGTRAAQATRRSSTAATAVYSRDTSIARASVIGRRSGWTERSVSITEAAIRLAGSRTKRARPNQPLLTRVDCERAEHC